MTISAHSRRGRAGPSVADEPPSAQLDHDGAATQRFIRDAAVVTAVDPARAPPAGWPLNCRCASAGFEIDSTVEHLQALNREAGEVRNQDWKLQ
jgi:hypothetical protein